jgi:hypothetical protein
MRAILFAALFLRVLTTSATNDTARVETPAGQGIVDLLMEYLEVHYKAYFHEGDLLYVSVHRQTMFHVRDGRLARVYPISTAKNGLGSEKDSYRTPTGLHRISEKFGDGVPELGVFKDRKFIGHVADTLSAGALDRDQITTRVLWLEGLEPGHNRGGDRDSHGRFIYIHGTSNEAAIGSPVSRGCIRMRNREVIDLYEQVPVGTPVVILDN